MSSKKDGGKSSTLSLRLDPKTKFILEFAGRVKGQTITTVVERAIRASCSEVTVNGERGESISWQDLWDPEEGVRTLKLVTCAGYPSTYDEDDLRRFAEVHSRFFFGGDSPNRAYVAVLWPKLEEYRRIWLEQREKDYWAAGRAMAADLQAAKVKPPTWPPEPRTATPLRRAEMDDEIPF
jgi:hypothetical protein